MKRIGLILIFIFSFLAIWSVDIVNRTEAEDAFEYAYQAENGGPDWLYHSHHLLPGALNKDIYAGFRSLGYGGRAYDVLRLVSALCGAGAILLFYMLCRRNLKINPVGAFMAAMLLLFSYGFWRYANESELIAPATLMALLGVYLALREVQAPTDVFIGAVVCGLAVLIHIMNAIPVFIAIPAIFILRRDYRRLGLHIAIAGAFVLGAYAAIHHFETEKLLIASSPAPSLSLAALPKALASILHNIASTNFLFGFAPVRDFLAAAFPSRMLLEEFLMGATMPRSMAIGGVISAILFSIALLTTLILGVRARRAHAAQENSRKEPESQLPKQTGILAAVWTLVFGAAVLIIEPGNPEVWTQVLPPILLLFALFAIGPLARASRLWPVLLTVILLAGHNYFAGLLPLKDPAGDYNLQKSGWLIENARPNDMVLTAGNPVFERYLRYHTAGTVSYLYRWPDKMLREPGIPLNAIAQRAGQGGRVFIAGDIFDQPESLRLRFPDKTAAIDVFAGKIAPHSRRVKDDPYGGIYILRLR